MRKIFPRQVFPVTRHIKAAKDFEELKEAVFKWSDDISKLIQWSRQKDNERAAVELGGYVQDADLATYVQTSDLTGYVQNADLDDYVDDENLRVRKAYCKAAAGAATTITCYLDTDGTGTEITVNCSIAGSVNLNAAVPRLADGTLIFVSKIGGAWYCISPFQKSRDCS